MTSTSQVEKNFSFLRVVEKVDNFPYSHVPSNFYTLKAHDDSMSLGYITSEVVHYLSLEPQYFEVDESKKHIKFVSSLDSFEKRSLAMSTLAEKLRKLPAFEVSLDKGWRGELYVAFDKDHNPYFAQERAFSVLLGVVTYGVHINGYINPQNSSNGKFRFWVPRRSSEKPTWPGKLDNTIAGGAAYPHGLWKTVVKESYEEAGLSESFVKLHARPNGVCLYMFQPSLCSDDSNFPPEGCVVQPEVQYIYDLEFDDETTIVPHPVDGEAESFQLMDADEVLARIVKDEFKPNCALVFLDFFIRHGLIIPEKEPNYMEIVSRCHRRLPFPTR